MTNPKQIKCPACSRAFGTKRALAQHRSASHGSGAPKNNGARAPGAPISKVSKVQQKETDSIVLDGIDRFFHIDDVSRVASGEVMYTNIVDVNSFKRLKVVAEAFQKVRYMSLEFHIEPQVPTTIGGGYVAGFIRDPADVTSNIDALTSQQGSVTTKWWQNAVIKVPVSDRDYYTSNSVELREYSPGRFTIMADTRANQTGGLTVFVRWKVRLYHASFEMPKQIETVVSTLLPIQTRSGYNALHGKKPDGSFTSQVSEMFSVVPSLKSGYLLPYPVTITDGQDRTLPHFYITVASASTCFLAGKDLTDYITENHKTDSAILPAGTVVAIEEKRSENYSSRREQSCTSGETSSQHLSDGPISSSEDLARLLSTFLGLLSTSRMQPLPQGASTLQPPESLTESRDSSLSWENIPREE